MAIKLECEVKSVQSRTTASGDKEVVLKFVTGDLEALKVGTLPSDATVQVEITG